MRMIIPAYQIENVKEVREGKVFHSFAIIKNRNGATCAIANNISDVLAGASILNYRQPVYVYSRGKRWIDAANVSA